MTAADMIAALKYAAELGTPAQQAATHLLLFTDLPVRTGFARFVEVEPVEGRDGIERPAAYPKWRELAAAADELRLHSAARRLLDLAASYATGAPVDLRETAGLGGHAHARAAIEAAIIAHDVTGYYTLAEGPELERTRAFHAEMQA